jgi:hypothetical protein
MNETLTADSSKEMEFLLQLRQSFNIGRDQFTNKPFRLVPGEINSNIGTNYGNIGGKNNTVNNYVPPPRVVTDKLMKDLTRLLPDKADTVAVIPLVENDESRKFCDAITQKLKESGYPNAQSTIGLVPGAPTHIIGVRRHPGSGVSLVTVPANY